MLSFTTESGSTYQLDLMGKRLRRLEGTTPLTRVGPHGEWRTFTDVKGPNVGENLVVVWRFVDEGGMLVAKTTVTSRVTSVSEVADA